MEQEEEILQIDFSSGRCVWSLPEISGEEITQQFAAVEVAARHRPVTPCWAGLNLTGLTLADPLCKECL